MVIKILFYLFFGITYGYNIDVKFPIIYSRENTFENSNSYFGYTVYLYHDQANNASWLIIGAPRGNYSGFSKQIPHIIEPGVAYRCEIKSEECEEIRPQIVENETKYIRQYMKGFVKTQGGWFGGAISIDETNGMLTVCAPRTVLTIYHHYSMHGMCYSGMVSSNLLSFDDKDFQFYDFSSPFWYDPLHGFSIHHATIKHKVGNEKKSTRIVGEPKHQSFGSVDVLYLNKRRSVEMPSSDELSQFGYSVESGYFFSKDELLFVSGAPGWRYVGRVEIINPTRNEFFETKLHGMDSGEYFGASLAVGDLNNDGLDDLLVGAPYWGEDNGKVYAYFGTSKRQFEMAVIIEGAVEGGRFGHAIASGDLDADGFDDIIVGAPWEDHGVIYIYNGGSDFKSRTLQASQRVDVVKFSHFNHPWKIERFGFSVSKPVDVDENGYLDIAVGAYKSGHAVLLYGRPVVKTELTIETIPNILQRDTKQFLVNICPRYVDYKVPHIQKFKVTVIIDERYQRTKNTVLELESSNLKMNMCLSAQINILNDIQDFIEPISIFAKHDFIYNNATDRFCKWCPVERKNNKLQVTQTLLSFNIGCGEDRVCNSDISAVTKFYDVQDKNIWIIGSNDISLEITLKNRGEPAYLTTVEFELPKGVILRSILTSCQEDTFKEHLIVICEAGNPIWKDEEKSVKLDLDMRHLSNDSIHDYRLNFRIKIKTRSINHGTIDIIETLNLINEVSLSLHGQANEEAYYLTTSSDIASNISFQHIYQVYKLGASPLEDAQLIIKVPEAIKDSETLVYVYKPQLYISGEFFECSSENILLDSELLFDQFDMSMISDEIRSNSVHILQKRNLNKPAKKFDDVKNAEVSHHLNESLINNIVYMNCSNPEINCTTVTCNLNKLKTLKDIGKLVIKFSLNVKGIKGNLKDNKLILKYISQASVKIIKPTIRLDVNGTCSAVEVVTMFYNTPSVEELKLWIVLVSVSVGLLLLLIFITILSTLGFFKRKGKQDLTDLKDNETTEKETRHAPESDNT